MNLCVPVPCGGPFRPDDLGDGKENPSGRSSKRRPRRRSSFGFNFPSGLSRPAEVLLLLQDYYVIRILLLLATIVGESGDRDRVFV